jgi:hypothetical protein
MATNGTGLLVIRAYLEPKSSSPLRAEIRLTGDVSAGMGRTINLVDADAVVQVVRDWLTEILDGPAAGSERPASRLPTVMAGGSGARAVDVTTPWSQMARRSRAVHFS